MRIIWCMIPEIWSAIGRNFYQFGTFTPLTTQKIKILKKQKNHLYIFNKCYSYNHMMYDSWNMERNRKYFCHFGSFFAFSPSSPLKKFKKAKKKKKTIKNQNFEKMQKTTWDIIILHMCTKNYDHMMYGSWDMEWNRQNFLSFGSFLILLSHYQPGKSKFLKYEKNYWRCYHFTRVYQKLWSYDVQFVGYDVWHIDGQIDRRTDGQTDRQSEKVTYRVQY